MSLSRGTGWLLVVLLVAGRCADAAALSPEKIVVIHAELKSQSPENRLAALNELSALDKVPDEFVPDLLADYEAGISSAIEDQKNPPASQEEVRARLKVLISSVAEGQLLESIWSKTDPAVVAQAIRPLLADPSKRALIIEIPSYNKGIAKELLPDLIKLLGDPQVDDNSHYFVCDALTPLGAEAKGAVPSLLGELGSSHEKIREDASRTLVAIGVTDPGAVPILIKGTADSDVSVSGNCGDLLKKLNYKPSDQLKPLLDALNGSFNYQAIDALVKVGPQVIEPVKEHAATAPFEGIDNHLCVLRNFKSKAVLAVAIDLNSTNANARYVAVDLMGEFPDKDHRGTDWLTPYLKDSDKNVRILALKSWVHAQKDGARRMALIRQDLDDQDLRDAAVDLAAEQGANAKPLLPAIKTATRQLTDDTTKIAYLTDQCLIDPADPAPLDQLLAYVRGSNTDLVSNALNNIYYDKGLRKRAEPFVQKIYEDPSTPSLTHFSIQTAREEAKAQDEADKSN